MLARLGATAAVAVVLMGTAGSARAQAPLRALLKETPTVPPAGMSGSAATLTLGLDLNDKDADIVPTWGRSGGRGWGGGRGWAGGRGWGGRGWGGYRGWGWGGSRGYGWGGYRSFYGWGGYGAGYSPFYYSGYSGYPYSYYYYTPPVYYYYWAPIGLTAVPDAAADTTARRVEPRAPYAAPSDGTYPYNGGPLAPVPLPKGAPETPKTAPPPATAPMEGRTVSIPARPKYTYPAYGEEPSHSGFAQDRTTTVVNKK